MFTKADLIILEWIPEQMHKKQGKEFNKDATVAHQQAVNILKQQALYQDSIKTLYAQAPKHKTEHAKVQLKKLIKQAQGSQIKHILKQDWQPVLHNWVISLMQVVASNKIY